jgi:hypothetical protein
MKTHLEKILSRHATCALALALLAAPGLASAAELVHAKDGSGIYGYKDTPKLPWCEWLVHDPDRPAPKKVDPGPAAPPMPAPAGSVVLFDGGHLQWTD